MCIERAYPTTTANSKRYQSKARIDVNYPKIESINFSIARRRRNEGEPAVNRMKTRTNHADDK